MNDRWELRIIDTSEVDGYKYYRVIDPTGYEQWMSQDEWYVYQTNIKKRRRKENLNELLDDGEGNEIS